MIGFIIITGLETLLSITHRSFKRQTCQVLLLHYDLFVNPSMSFKKKIPFIKRMTGAELIGHDSSLTNNVFFLTPPPFKHLYRYSPGY